MAPATPCSPAVSASRTSGRVSTDTSAIVRNPAVEITPAPNSVTPTVASISSVRCA
ncbi:hypothetical protein STANM309S_05909 [Streptomyces tanashiensis]